MTKLNYKELVNLKLSVPCSTWKKKDAGQLFGPDYADKTQMEASRNAITEGTLVHYSKFISQLSMPQKTKLSWIMYSAIALKFHHSFRPKVPRS